jgi:hypothetical protein
MPSKVSVLDSNTGLTSLQYGVEAAEMVKNDPGRYSITDRTAEVAARNGRGVAAQSRRLIDKNGEPGLA